MSDYQIKKRVIDSLLENFDWETNPQWEIHLRQIDNKIRDFWEHELKRKYEKGWK